MRRFFALLWLLLFVGASQAQVNLLANGDFAQEAAGWTLTGGDKIKPATLSIVGQPFKKALQLTLDAAPGAPGYSLLMRQPVNAAFRQGEPLTLKLWLRSPSNNKIAVFHEEIKEPNSKSLGRELVLTPDWKEYELAGATKVALAAGESAVTFHLGYAPGTVEIANLRLTRGAAAGAMSAGAATEAVPPLTNGDFAGGNQGWKMLGLDRAKASLVRVQAGPFRQAARLEVTPQTGDKPTAVMLNQPLAVALKKDDPLLLAVWMRSPESAKVTVTVEQAVAPYAKAIYAETLLTPDWREYYFSGKSPQDFAPGDARLNFYLAHGPGTIEVTGARMAVGQAAALSLDPNSLLINGDFSKGTISWQMPTDVKWSILDAQAGNFRQTLHFDVAADVQPWSKNLKQPLTMGLKQGTPLALHVWMRSASSNRTSVMVEESGPPHAKTLYQDITLTPQWKEYEVKGVTAKDYAPGQLTITVFLSRDTGAIELTGMHLMIGSPPQAVSR